MSDPWGPPWSNRPNAPQIPSWLHAEEKDYFAGILIGAISYGIVVALFFQCMATLLNPASPIRKGIRWALMAHTVALFLFLTIPFGIYFDRLSIEYINNREFPGNDEFAPGPMGYDDLLDSGTTTTVFNVMFPLNQWLADGLLLHRCYIIYSMNHWVMAFPYLMYLAAVVLGIADIYYSSGTRFYTVTETNVHTSYISISLGLNILLTLMIVIRLIVHIRNIRNATGASDGYNGFHTVATTVITMLIESYALYAGLLLAYTISWAVNSWVINIFNGVVGTFQVIAPYLIILRVAKRRAMTSESISGISKSIHFRSQRSTDGEEDLPDGDHTNATEVSGEAARAFVAGDENTIGEVTM